MTQKTEKTTRTATAKPKAQPKAEPRKTRLQVVREEIDKLYSDSGPVTKGKSEFLPGSDLGQDSKADDILKDKPL